MTFARKLALAVAATALGTSLIGLSAPPANAGDTSWGCGGLCRPGR